MDEVFRNVKALYTVNIEQNQKMLKEIKYTKEETQNWQWLLFIYIAYAIFVEPKKN